MGRAEFKNGIILNKGEQHICEMRTLSVHLGSLFQVLNGPEHGNYDDGTSNHVENIKYVAPSQPSIAAGRFFLQYDGGNIEHDLMMTKKQNIAKKDMRVNITSIGS